MKIVENISDLDRIENTCITVGTFDGVHLGHSKIFETLFTKAKECGCRSVILTFDPHPRLVVSKNFKIKLLTSLDEKRKLIENFDIDIMIIQKFTSEFAKQTSQEFVENYLIKKIGLKHFIIGHDHKFGNNRGGDETKLKELGTLHDFAVTTVEPVLINEQIVSSTTIRNLLSAGEVGKSNLMLGRNYSFTGIVVSGATRGKILGFPTANLNILDEYKLIPQTGVYAVECLLNDEKLFGIMNIGYRPTFETDGDLVIEVHLFEFNRDIYGQKLEVNLLKKLRDERKFNSKEELIYQIEKDKKQAIQFIGALIN